MDFTEFLRLFSIRHKNLGWFFGAGTSVASGMPSAYDLIWQFKRLIYCTEQRKNISLYNNLSSPAIRRQIQSYFDNKSDFPKEDSLEEYSFYFEKAYPSPKDRADFLMSQLQGMQNSFGHKVLGIMLKHSLVQLIFTTNFDKAFENAANAELKSLDKFLVATLENTRTAIQKYKDGFRPLIVKLHGDYFSEKLKNTTDELQEQDKELRQVLFQTCVNQGIGFMGYSGRDASIMEVLEAALETPLSFPQGIFWFVRPNTTPIPAVLNFIQAAKAKGVQAEIIEIETFDTAWGEMIKVFDNLPAEDLAKINENYFRTKHAPVSAKGSKFPYVRFNAIAIAEHPLTARLIKCNAGNEKELQTLLESKKSELLAIRKRDGVVGFGKDQEFENILSEYGSVEKDTYQIQERVLGYDDSTLKALITKALLKSITRGTKLSWTKRRERYLIFPTPTEIKDDSFSKLKEFVGRDLSGKIPKTKLPWTISLEASIHRKFDKNFLVLSPTVLAGKKPADEDRPHIAPFIKEFMAGWYNNKYPKILDAWLDIIFQDQKELVITAFDNDLVGFNSRFKLSRNAPYSKSI